MSIEKLPGAPFFHRDEQGALLLESVPLQTLAHELGTPLFVYSQAAIEHALAAWQRGLAGRDALICYAVKANSSQAILSLLAQAGCGFDIVSGGELARALAAGAEPEKIIFSGVGKTRAEILLALKSGIGCFNVESLPELEQISQIAQEHELLAPVSLRINPDVDARTHPYISTGLKGNKFGIAHDQALAAYQRAATLPGLRIVGADCHIGSQITETAPYLDALDRMLELIETLEAAGIAIGHLDMGGGLGITYSDETPPDAEALCQKLLARLDARGHGQRRLIVEPGRALVGNAGVCLTEALYLKHGEHKNFCIVDAAMNDLIRPALYEAHHHITAVQPRPDAAQALYDVVGPVCESGDWLGQQRLLAVQPGDVLAVLSAGAYCMSMASNYNSRPRAAEVLVSGDEWRVIRQRETVEDLLRNELP